MNINTNDTPVLPWDWMTVESNTTYGEVDISKLILYEPKGKTLEEVKKEVKNMKPANWSILQYLYEHPENVPEEFKKYWCYFYGTELRDRDGRWDVPYGYWYASTSEFNRSAYWLDDSWDSGYRVVLLDDSSPLKLEKELDIESLSLRLEKLEQFYETTIELIPALADVADQ